MENNMEIWLDSADTDFIKNTHYKELLNGITTNPSIMAESQQSPLKTIDILLTLRQSPVCVQVTAQNTDEIITQAEYLHTLYPRIIIKIPII